MSELLRYKARKETKRILLHDSHTEPDICVIKQVPRWADLAHDGALKMGLLSIGYHFIIERDGKVIKCRDRGLIGSHTPGHNLDSIGICLVGGREKGGSRGEDNFTYSQRHALLCLVHELRFHYRDITVENVKAHSEVQRFRRGDHPPCPPIDMEVLRADIMLYEKGYVL